MDELVINIFVIPRCIKATWVAKFISVRKFRSKYPKEIVIALKKRKVIFLNKN